MMQHLKGTQIKSNLENSFLGRKGLEYAIFKEDGQTVIFRPDEKIKKQIYSEKIIQRHKKLYILAKQHNVLLIRTIWRTSLNKLVMIGRPSAIQEFNDAFFELIPYKHHK